MQLTSIGQYPVVQKINYTLPTREPVFTVACQDHPGYLWLGSGDGLFRYDGFSFKQYIAADHPDDLKVSAIYESPSGILWVGCLDGRIYQLSGNKLFLFDPEEGTAGVAISDILEDEQGVLWWSTLGEGIYYYHNRRVYHIGKEDALADDYVYDMELDPSGMIYAGTDAGISMISIQENQKMVETPEVNLQLPDIIVMVLKNDPAGGLWLGHYDYGISYLEDLKIRSGVPSWTQGPVKDLIVQKDVLWIATASGEIYELARTASNHTLKPSIPIVHPHPGRVHDLLEDSEGNIWILANSGLYRTTGTKLISYPASEISPSQPVHAIFPDRHRHNIIWFSNDQGLFTLDTETGIPEKFITKPPLTIAPSTCIYQDDHGDIWIGTFNLGALKIDVEQGSWVKITENDGLVNNNVLSISGHLDTLWLATLGGATEIVLDSTGKRDVQQVRSFNRENGLVSNYIYAIYEDAQDRIWFATDGDGVSVFANGEFTIFNKNDGLKDDVIYSITGDKYGNIWLATATAGIAKYDGVAFRNFGLEAGLSSLEISGLLTSQDEVMILQDNGIDILHIPTGRIAHLGQEAGLSSINPGLNVAARDLHGDIWFGTASKGIFRYRPGIHPEAYGPKTILEEMWVFMEPVAMQDHLKLNSKENHISFRYTGLYFTHPGKVLYQVMLDGYDLGWKGTFDRTVTYSSLPPGEYIFRVRSSLDDSFRHASEVAYTFRIKKPFWMNWWFFVLAGLSLATLTYGVVIHRERKLRKAELRKKEQVEFEFQVLKNQVNPHFLFNSFSTLISLIEEQPGQAVQFTEKLSDFFRTILQLKDQEVIGFREELDLVNNYFFLLKQRFGDNLSLEMKIEEAVLDTFIPPMTLQILLENAVKHNIVSKEKPLRISIYSTHDHIIVENSLQRKLNLEPSTGTGLENVKKRYRLLIGIEPEILEDEQIFKVILPIITNN